MQIDPRLTTITENYPYPLLFATISGAHLYGFPSPDSDYDLRGVHILPLQAIIGLDGPEETVTVDRVEDGLHLDLVTHDIHFYFKRLLTRNGSLLDQIYSLLVVFTTPAHEELKVLARQCLTTQHHRHYLGLAASQWKLFMRGEPRRVKPLLYVYRALLCGIHLMRTGEVESNLLHLNAVYALPYIDQLVERKVAGPEKATLSSDDVAFHEAEYARLQADLESSSETKVLSEAPSDKTRQALNDLLLRLRLGDGVQ